MENIQRIEDTTEPENDETNDILPANLTKLIAKFDLIRDKISEQKNSLDDINKEIRTFEKLINKFVKSYLKKETKQKKPRKKSGFALPVTISDELCDFMGCEKGSKRARTQVTQFLMSYISENNLKFGGIVILDNFEFIPHITESNLFRTNRLNVYPQPHHYFWRTAYWKIENFEHISDNHTENSKNQKIRRYGNSL